MKKITFLILILSMFSCAKKIYTSNEYFNCNNISDFNADTDKKQLIYTILERAVVSKKDIADYHLISDKNKVYVSDIAYSKFFGGIERPSEIPIEKSEVPNKINNVKFCIKSKPELQKIADETGNFLYLTLGNIEIKENTAKIGVMTSWSVSEKNKRKMVMMSGGGYVWEFEKKDGNWIFIKIISNFQS